jgi:DNA-binding PadR family transcriptional regulator
MMAPKKPRDPASFLPLTPRVFHVLLALAEGPLHGYAVIQEVKAQTAGVIVLRTGTLYMLVQRLVDQDLIDESDDRPHPDEDDERRRYYTLTPTGRAVLQAESRRLQQVLGTVRRKNVLGVPRT